jgi:ribulose-5-phosphate 4-epimerase/fuculose-1-phosphate aldolase
VSSIKQIKYDLALANRMMANEGVLDTFGHISARHPEKSDRYFLSRSRAPELIEPDDLVEYDLDSGRVSGSTLPSYSERVIHGEIYKARPDVMAICHHHAAPFMPLVITGTDYIPVAHLGSVGGYKPPYWDQRAEFGDTDYLVVKPEEGRSLAKALANHKMVLMNRHGVTVVGVNLVELAFRCVFSCRNAEYQLKAAQAGTLDPLSRGDIELGARIGGATTGQIRAWEHWTVRLKRAGWLPPAASE